MVYGDTDCVRQTGHCISMVDLVLVGPSIWNVPKPIACCSSDTRRPVSLPSRTPSDSPRMDDQDPQVRPVELLLSVREAFELVRHVCSRNGWLCKKRSSCAGRGDRTEEERKAGSWQPAKSAIGRACGSGSGLAQTRGSKVEVCVVGDLECVRCRWYDTCLEVWTDEV